MKFFKKSDLIIITLLLLISLASYTLYDRFAKDKPVKAEIYYYSELVQTIRLDQGKNDTFSLNQNPNVILQTDEDGGIAFIASDCPDKICIKTGKLHKIGEYAACLPNGIVVKIVPKGERGEDDADIIVN